MELVQGVVLRYRVEGQKEAEAFVAGLDKASKAGTAAGQGLAQAATGAKATGAAAKEAGASVGTMQGQLAKLANFVLPAGIVAGIALIGKRAIDAADQMEQMSKRTGASVETLSKLSYAAKLADTDMQAVSTGFRAMARTVDEAAKGNADLRASFASVGVTLEDLRTKNPEQLFLAIANGIAGIEDPTTRAARAQELMGRSAQELLPLMQDLSGNGYAKVSAEAERMNAVISTETARAAEEFNDNLDAITAGLQGGANTITAALMPALRDLSETLKGSTSDGILKTLAPMNLLATAVKGISGLVVVLTGQFRIMTVAAGAALDGLAQAWDRIKAKDFRGAFGDLTGINASANSLISEEQARIEASLRQIFSPKAGSAMEGAAQATRTIAATTSESAKNMDAMAKSAEKIRKDFSGLNYDIPWLSDTDTSAVNTRTLMLAEQIAKLKAVGNERGAAQWQKAMDEMGPILVKSTEAVAPQISATLANSMRLSLGDALADVAQTGGKNLGEIAGRMFSSMVTEGADSIIQSFSVGAAKLFGDKITQKDGKWYLNGKEVGSFDEAMAGSKASRVIAGGQAVLGAGLTGYQTGQAGEGGRTAGAVSGLMAGAATGNPFIAIGAMIAGYIGGILGEQQRQADYKYGIPRFVNGVASLGDTKNINPAERQQMEAQLQSVFTSTWNQFTRILLTLPGASMPSMPASFGEAFQDNPSGKYMKHFDEYLKNTLPREIAELFKSGMEDAFVGSGVTKEAFARFWKEAEGLDAATRGQFWSDLAEGLAALSRAQANMAAVRSNWTESDQFGSVRMGRFQFTNGRVMETGESKFEADIRNAGEGLFRIGREMVNLTGPERVAAFKALGQGIEAVTLSLQAYIEQIGDTIRGLARTFADERFAKEVERAATPQDKAAILWANYNANLGAIGMMKDPAEIERLTRRNVEILNQIYALDPSAEMYEWWKRQMSTLEMISTSSLEKLAAAATSKVDAVLASVKPFTDWMMGLPVNLQPAWAALDTGIRGAADALRDLEAAIRNATNPAPGNGGGNPGGGGPGGGGNDAGATSLVINMNGSYTDREALRRDVVAAVRSAVSTNPNLLDGAF